VQLNLTLVSFIGGEKQLSIEDMNLSLDLKILTIDSKSKARTRVQSKLSGQVEQQF
jgi:hypothetical protein